jgi:hypothetical protein
MPNFRLQDVQRCFLLSHNAVLWHNTNLSRNVAYSKIQYEKDDIFKNGYNKKGVETSKLSNDT